MPVYRVNIDREVVTYDRFTRYIRADSVEAATEIASQMADDANLDCPDDAGTGNFDPDLGDWEVNDAEEMTDEEVRIGADVIFGPDGEEEDDEEDDEEDAD